MRAESELRRRALVVGPGAAGFLRVDLGSKRGSAHDGIVEVPVERIPAHLRTPNSRFVAVTTRDGVIRVEDERVGLPKLDVEESVRRVLNRWDPIGTADVVEDEYDIYIPQILDLLRSGADEATVARHLWKIEHEWMGLGIGSWEQRLPIASELRRLALPPR